MSRRPPPEDEETAAVRGVQQLIARAAGAPIAYEDCDRAFRHHRGDAWQRALWRAGYRLHPWSDSWLPLFTGPSRAGWRSPA